MQYQHQCFLPPPQTGGGGAIHPNIEHVVSYLWRFQFRFYDRQFPRARLHTVEEPDEIPEPFKPHFLLSCIHLSDKLPGQLARLRREWEEMKVSFAGISRALLFAWEVADVVL